jgi:hypothetical protein
MKASQSDMFQLACIAKVARDERESLMNFVAQRCDEGEDINDRSIREWVDLWRTERFVPAA